MTPTVLWWLQRVQRPLLAAFDGVGCLSILGVADRRELVELMVVGNARGLDAAAWRGSALDLLGGLGFTAYDGWHRGRDQWGGVEWRTSVRPRVYR